VASLFALIFLASVPTFFVGLIKPRWVLPKVEKPTRQLSMKVWGGTFFASLLLTGLTAPKSEPPSTTASPQPVVVASPATTAAPPSPSVAPSPTPQVVRSPGIGVSRTAIQSIFEQSEIGFTFESSSSVASQPRVMGTSRNRLATIELIGPSSELVSASILIGIPNDDTQARNLNVAYTLGFIKHAAPEWIDGPTWFNDQIVAMANGASTEASTTFSDKQATLNVIKEMGIFTLTIKPR